VIKRFIGREFSDEGVKKDMKWMPYDVINKDDKPYV